MPLVCASVPWAAAGSFVCARGIAVKRQWSPRFARNAGIAAGSLLVAASIVVQMQPNHLNHLSRWGHWARGNGWRATPTDREWCSIRAAGPDSCRVSRVTTTGMYARR